MAVWGEGLPIEKLGEELELELVVCVVCDGSNCTEDEDEASPPELADDEASPPEFADDEVSPPERVVSVPSDFTAAFMSQSSLAAAPLDEKTPFA